MKIEHKTSLIYRNEKNADNPILALQSSICTNSPFNNVKDNILCMFTFFPTHKELLSNAEFPVVNLKQVNNRNGMKDHQLAFIY